MKLKSITVASNEDSLSSGQKRNSFQFNAPHLNTPEYNQNARSIVEVGSQAENHTYLGDVNSGILDSQSIRSKIDRGEQAMAIGHVSYFFGARAMGAIVFSLVGGFALENFSKPTIFRLSALCPLLLFLYVAFIFEEKEDSVYSEETTTEEIRTIIEAHMKQNKSSYMNNSACIEDSPAIHFESDKFNDMKTPIYATKPSQHQEAGKTPRHLKEDKNSSGFIQEIKTTFGFSSSTHSKEENRVALPKTKYDFRPRSIKTRLDSGVSEQTVSVSDNFSHFYNKAHPNFMRDMKKILYVMKHPKMRRLMLLVGLVMFTPSFSSTWNYYLTNVIKLQPEDMGELNFMSSIGYFIGIMAMNSVFSGISLRNFYRGTTIIGSVLLCTGLVLLFRLYDRYNIPVKLFCALNSLVSNFINELNILPILALCSRFCPKNLEAMSYAVFMSFLWIAFYVSQGFGISILCYFKVSQLDFSSFWKCIVFQTLYGVTVAIIISFVDFPEDFDDVVKFMKSKSFSYFIFGCANFAVYNNIFRFSCLKFSNSGL